MNDLFFSLVDFSPVVCLEIGSRDDSICLNFSIKKVLCVLFFCCLDSRNKSTSRSCIFYFPHFCFTRFFARNCYFVLFRKFSLFFWYFVVCLFGLLLTAYSLTSVKLLHEAIISQEN